MFSIYRYTNICIFIYVMAYGPMGPWPGAGEGESGGWGRRANWRSGWAAKIASIEPIVGHGSAHGAKEMRVTQGEAS